MNMKNISIALSVVVVLLLATLLMQKGSYVSQATEHYEKTTTKSFKGASQIIEYVNNSIETNKGVWTLACEAVQSVKTSQDQARLEAKLFPSVKGTMSIANKTRKFEASSDYYIVSNFAKVEVDKKTEVKSLSGLVSVNVNALLGNAAVAASDEDEEEGEEAVVEEAPAPKKAAKGKKGKKGKKR
ncbi:hypothetical protein [Fibrobacter sp. UWH1]|uniref:hypothetical protein n=1 Tax=Fibrobacter sp. UWH1 TaxID=1964354 RepID=UPI0015950AEE|nr:hypothetical protein [Fibrobacter sp. UWH1]